MVRAGKNPVTEKLKACQQAAATKTFMEAARAFLPTIEAEMKSDKTRAVWRAALLGEVVGADGKVTKTENNYCAKLHRVPVVDIDTPLVLAVLNPISTTKPETAGRLRGRIERVLSWAIGQGMGGGIELDRYRNPARWDGHLEHGWSLRPRRTRSSTMPHSTMHRCRRSMARSPNNPAWPPAPSSSPS